LAIVVDPTMTFDVAADAYDRYMGRYSEPLAALFADFACVRDGQRVLDVGSGPGALTSELASRVGADRVAAVEPSATFARACADRVRAADVRQGSTERLPWSDASFDVVLSQLVVNFLPDADGGVREMRRVTRIGGMVAACTWDYRGEMQMLRTFWDAALTLDPSAPDEARIMRYADPDSLRDLWTRAGLHDVEASPLTTCVEYSDFDDYWQPFLTGTGPGGEYCVSLDPGQQAALRDECSRRLGAPTGTFTLPARAWAVRGVA
jgi:ubiquinone/menaquinone biosynthesis C-methylase UbiE